MPTGIFDLTSSDNTVSSYYKLCDLVTIINSRLNADNHINKDFIKRYYGDLISIVDNEEVIDEKNGLKYIWEEGYRRIPTSWKLTPKKINIYELVLYNIFTRVVGTENVNLQFKIPNQKHSYDFMIKYSDLKVLRLA